jgi:hypothetical protein
MSTIPICKNCIHHFIHPFGAVWCKHPNLLDLKTWNAKDLRGGFLTIGHEEMFMERIPNICERKGLWFEQK